MDLIKTYHGKAMPIRSRIKNCPTPKQIASIAFVATLGVNSFAFAEPSEQLMQLQTLIEEKRAQEAFDLSTDMLEQWGGEPDFDFFAGRAAFMAKHFQEAVFAFERVMFNRPKHIQSRLLLAFSYFKVNNYGAAKTELNWFLARPELVSASDLATIKNYLSQIEEAEKRAVRDTSFEVGMGIGHDTNVNSGTETDSIFFPSIGDFITLTDGLELDDTVSDLSLSFRHREKLSQTQSYSVAANFNHVMHHENNEFDRSLLNLTASYNGSLEDTWIGGNYSASTFFQPMYLDDKFFRTAIGVSLSNTWQFAESWTWMLGINYSLINNVQQDAQDMRRSGISTRFTWLGSHPQIIDLFFTHDDAAKTEGEHNGRDFYGISYTYLYPASNTLSFMLRLNADKAEYASNHPTFLLVRDEDSIGATLTANYKITPDWKTSATVRFSDRSSNLSIYEFDRTEVRLGVSRTFK